MIYPVYLVRAEDDLVALHLAIALSRHVPTALWRPGGPEGSFDGLAVVDGDDLWNAAVNAKRYALALVYAGEGPADAVVRGSTGCRTYGVYSRLLKQMEEPATSIAVQALEWRRGEVKLDVERREGELPRLIVVVPRGVGIKELAKALRRYNPVVHRDLATGLADEIMPWVKRRWPKRGLVIAPAEEKAPEWATVLCVGDDPSCVPLDRVEEELRRIILQSPCVFGGQYEEPIEFKPKGAPKPLSPEWARRLAQGISCRHELLCLNAIWRWPRLAYYMRRFSRLADKLAALAVTNEGQLAVVLKMLAAEQDERDIERTEIPDYTEIALLSLQQSDVVKAQVRASPPRRPPLVGKLGYIAVPLSLAGSLLLGIGLAPFTWGLSLALPALYTLAWPDAVLAWFYSLSGIGIEPRLYYLGDGRHRDVFGRMHVVYRVSPRFNALMESAHTAYDTYIRLADDLQLSPDEAIEVRYFEDRVLLRYTGKNWETVRGRLDSYFYFFEPVALTQEQLPAKPLGLVSRALLVLGALAGLTAVGIPAVGMLMWSFAALALRRRARAYAAAKPLGMLTRFDVFAMRLNERPTTAQAIAESIASQAKEWSVVIRTAPEAEAYMRRKFAKYIQSARQTAKTAMGALAYSQAVERILTSNERGVYVQAFVPKPIDMGRNVGFSGSLGAFERWMFWHAKPALSGDLVALPLLATMMYSGKAVFLGHDRSGRPYHIYPETMPALHTVVFGATGMGKSWTVATLLMRLKRAGYKIHVTVIDPHGDYIRLRHILRAKEIVIGQKDYVDVFANANDDVIMLAEKLSIETFGKVMSLEELKSRYADKLIGNAVPVREVKDTIIAFSEKARDSPVFMHIYGSLLTFRLYQHAFDTIKEGSGEIWVIVLDEAYLFLDKEILRNLLLGARKFGVAVWLVLHEAEFLTSAVLTSTPLKIFIGGANVVDALSKVMHLDPEDVRWLRTAPPPHVLDGRTQALVIHGPADHRYHVYIQLEPIVKRGRFSLRR